jgi:hypothetical protein
VYYSNWSIEMKKIFTAWEEYLRLAPNAPDANQLQQEIAKLKASP